MILRHALIVQEKPFHDISLNESCILGVQGEWLIFRDGGVRFDMEMLRRFPDSEYYSFTVSFPFFAGLVVIHDYYNTDDYPKRLIRECLVDITGVDSSDPIKNCVEFILELYINLRFPTE